MPTGAARPQPGPVRARHPAPQDYRRPRRTGGVVGPGPQRTPRPPSWGLRGTALAVPVLVLVAWSSRSPHPPLLGDGTWAAPIRILLAVVALGALAVLVLFLRHLSGGSSAAPPTQAPSRSWLPTIVTVAVVAWLAQEAGGARDAADGGGPVAGMPPPADGPVAALPTSGTAVVAGLVALAALAALTLLLLRWTGALPTRSVAPAPEGAATPRAGAGAAALPAGPPTAVVLAAWAAASEHVAAALGLPGDEPPGRLQQHVAGTDLAPPLRTLTELYLPVRYGRATATADDAARARAALSELRAAARVAAP